MLAGLFKQFLRDARAQKLRLALTLFGIVWGTAAVTILLAFGEGFYAQLRKTEKGLGENIVICWPSRTSKPWEGLPKGRRIRITEEDIELIRRNVPELSGISGEYSTSTTKLRVGRNVVRPWLIGTDPSLSLMRNLIPDEGGRYIDYLDVEHRKRTIFIGNELKKDLFGHSDAVGEYVHIRGAPFLVVGVMQGKTQNLGYNGSDSDKGVIASSTFRAIYGRKYVDNFVFQVKDPSLVEKASKNVVALLAQKHRFDPEDTEAVGMWDTTKLAQLLDVFFLGFRVFLGLVGALTLVVGGIGVSNIMNVVVEERTKEIGIKMALGARRGHVIGQFLFETLFITFLGGAIGFAITWLLCASVAATGLVEHVGTPVISLEIASITTAILGLVGFLAGFFPARTAASLNPVEALRL